jgi:hypothetical protein
MLVLKLKSVLVNDGNSTVSRSVGYKSYKKFINSRSASTWDGGLSARISCCEDEKWPPRIKDLVDSSKMRGKLYLENIKVRS